MNVCSYPFLVGIAGFSVCFQLCTGKRLRQFLLSSANLLFLSTHVPNWQSWICLTLFVAGTYGILCIVKSTPLDKVFYLVLVILVFVYMKRYPFVEMLLPYGLQLTAVEVVGLSFMLFKFIDALVHRWQGQLAPYDFVSYANYQLAFFTLLAGPIQRYNDFRRCWDRMDEEPGDARATLLCWTRILTGMLKIGLVARLVEYWFVGLELGSAPVSVTFERFLAHFYAYPIYVYMNFSGYTDAVIGCGGLLGFQLPENFNRPFFARSLLDFWSRWHMTLTQWIRDLIFIPWYKKGMELVPSWSRPLGFGLLFLSMCIVGAWHGLTAGFLAFGAIHGIGVVVNQAYADLLRSRLGRTRLQNYRQNRLIHGAATIATFHFVCFSFLFFCFTFEQALHVLNSAGNQLLAAFEESAESSQSPGPSALAVVLLLSALWLPWRTLGQVLCTRRVASWLTQSLAPLKALVFLETAVVVFLFLWTWFLQQQEPLVLYGRF